MMRNGQLVRCLTLSQRLKGGRFTLRQLANEHGVHERTIRRDMEALSVAGVPICNTADATATGKNGYWWIAR